MFNFLSIFSIVLLTFLLIPHDASNIDPKAEPDIDCYTPVALSLDAYVQEVQAHWNFSKSFVMNFCTLFPL